MSRGAGAARARFRGVEAVGRRVAGEYLLVPLRGRSADLQRVYALSAVAERVWESLCAGKTTVEELCADVLETFEVERAIAERDLLAFLDELEREGLVERAGPAGN